MGANVFTTHFLFFQNQPFSAIWIRIDLKNFSFSKRQRKLMRRNASLFDVACGPRIIDKERDDLYQRYAADFNGRISPTISDSLEDYDGTSSIFNTWETSVRDKVSEKLIAVSYFDLGDETAASILGVYDPLLKSFSLGYYTMLLEMEYCLERGLRYYYPGYVVPGYQRFDYKLRLGDSEYYDLRTESWLPYDQQGIELNGPTEIQRSALGLLQEKMHEKTGKKSPVFVYPLFEAGLYDMWDENYVPYPYLYLLGKDSGGNVLTICFDPKERDYLVLECQPYAEANSLFNSAYLNTFSEDQFFTDLLAIRTVLYRTSSLTTLLKNMSPSK